MKKHLLLIAVLLVAACAITLTLLPARAEGEIIANGTCGTNLIWSLDDAGLLTISGNGAMPNYNASSNVAPWFTKRTKITAVVIEAGVTSIGDYAFYACLKMESISIADSVMTIGKNTFKDCAMLAEVVIPDGITVIDDGTFSGCSRLSTITIPDSVTKIGYLAFSGCDGIKNVYISDVAAWCSIYFYHSNYYVPSLTEWPSNPLCYADNLYLNGKLTRDIVVPNGVTRINSSAFFGFSGLSSITLPDSVIEIGEFAFRDCSNLNNIIIPDSVYSIGRYGFAGCSSLEGVTIPDSIIHLEDSMFYRCSSLTSITIPDSVVSIGKYAFQHCGSLQSIEIPESVASIGKYAFQHCGSLQSIEIPKSVVSIGEFAFSGCKGLRSIVIQNGISTIDWYAFYGCVNLWHVLYKGTEAQWGAISIGSSNYELTSATRHYECTGGEITEEITSQPTCTDTGSFTHSCSVCNESKAGSLPALGHKWKPATCTDPKTCTVCAATEGEVLGAEGHNYVSVVTAPTCTAQGYTTHTCAVCGDSYVDSYTEILPHEMGEWYVHVAAGCLSDGVERRNCANCDYSETQEISATGHNYESVVTEPTWESGGYTTHTCVNCGDSYVDSYTDPLPYEPGDADGDGEVNTDDAIYLLYNVMFGDGDYPVTQECDFDGNGEVNTDDAIYLLYHVMFGEEDYPLH